MFVGLMFIAIAITLLSSCQTNPEQPQLTIKTTTNFGDESVEVISTINDVYYETVLSSYIEDETIKGVLLVEKNVYTVSDLEIFNVNGTTHFQYTELVDENTLEPLEFESPTEFLNYVASKGYEMVDQIKYMDEIEYTFKRK